MDQNIAPIIIYLGEFSDRYILTSEQHISERTISKIDEVANSMAEHGFYGFYQDIMDFKLKHLIGRLAQVKGMIGDGVDLQSITIEQLRKPVVIVLCLNGIATIVFVIEILVFKWLKWRNRKYLKFIMTQTFHFISFRFILSGRVQILPILPEHRSQPLPKDDLPSRRSRSAPFKMQNINRKHTKRISKKRHSNDF